MASPDASVFSFVLWMPSPCCFPWWQGQGHETCPAVSVHYLSLSLLSSNFFIFLEAQEGVGCPPTALWASRTLGGVIRRFLWSITICFLLSPPCIDDVGTFQYFSKAENNYLLLSVSQRNFLISFLPSTPNINFGQWRAGCMVLSEDFYLFWHTTKGRKILYYHFLIY